MATSAFVKFLVQWFIFLMVYLYEGVDIKT